MKVRAVKSFGGVGVDGSYHFPAGAVFDLPPDVDWLTSGLVVAVETAKPVETAAKKSPARKRTVTKRGATVKKS